jgi:ABC-2 type transport system permease protein
MLNVIKMDLYRMIKTKSFYVILMIIVVFMLFGSYMIDQDLSTLKEMAKDAELQTDQAAGNGADTDKNVNLGISFDATPLMQDNITLLDEASVMLSSAILLFFTGIFAVLFVCGENSTGFIKNIISCTKKRRYVILSKTVVMSIFVVLETIILLIALSIGSSIFHSSVSMKLSLSFRFLQYVGLQCLLHIAFAIIIIMISVIVRSTAISMMTSIGLSSGLGSLIISYLSMLKIGSFHVGENLVKYFVTTNVQALTSQFTKDMGIRVLMVSLAAILLYNIISCVVMDKRDI